MAKEQEFHVRFARNFFHRNFNYIHYTLLFVITVSLCFYKATFFLIGDLFNPMQL